MAPTDTADIRARALPDFVYRTLEVRRTEQVTPRLRRVTLAGPELQGFGTDRRGPNIKIYLPRPGQDGPVMPEPDDEGVLRWPTEDRRPVMRTYTVRRHDPVAGELDVDFVLHGAGAAGSWAAAAVAGDRLGVTGPGGPSVRAADDTVLVADLAAVPAVSVLLETLPADTRGTVLIGVEDPADRQELSGPPGMDVRWVPVPADHEQPLVDAALDLPRPTGSAFTWVSAESEVVRVLRPALRDRWELTARRQLCIGYWRRGLTEGEYDSVFGNDRSVEEGAPARPERA